MKQMIVETATEGATNWLALVLIGIGITASPHQYFGGLFMALGVASLVAMYNRENDRRRLWQVLITAAIVATGGHVIISAWWPQMPIQPVMIILGACSRYIVRIFNRFAGRIEDRTEDVADSVVEKVVAPKEDEK